MSKHRQIEAKMVQKQNPKVTQLFTNQQTNVHTFAQLESCPVEVRLTLAAPVLGQWVIHPFSSEIQPLSLHPSLHQPPSKPQSSINHHASQYLKQALKETFLMNIQQLHPPCSSVPQASPWDPAVRQRVRHIAEYTCYRSFLGYAQINCRTKNTSTAWLTFLVANVGLMAKTWSSPSSCCQWAELVLRERLRLWKELSALNVYGRRKKDTQRKNMQPIHAHLHNW